MLLFVPLFGAHDSTIVVSGSMLSGGALRPLCCCSLRPKLQTIAGRKMLSFFFALEHFIGTLLYAYPMFPSSPIALFGLFAFRLLLYRHRRFVVRITPA